MGHSREEKARSHERIVEIAAARLRESGTAGPGVAELMKEAGLTHGGFYAHFDSREGMLAEAADRAGADTVAFLTRVAAAAPAKQELEAMLRSYLSKGHVEGRESGCAVAALGSEMPRQAPKVRRAATRRIKEMIDLVARQVLDARRPGRRRPAIGAEHPIAGSVECPRGCLSDPSRCAGHDRHRPSLLLLIS